MTKNVLLGALGIAILGAILFSNMSTSAAPPAVSDLRAAQQACETWTRANSKLPVAEIVNTFEESKRTPRAGHFYVGIDYRAKGSGLLMRSACEYAKQGGSFVLLDAKSGANKGPPRAPT
jgi:hypothetical protein